MPDDRHVLVTFPVKLVYPVWQEYEQFDPYVLVQGTVSSTALGGVVNGGQLITEKEKYGVKKTSSSCNFHPLQGHVIAVLKTYFDIQAQGCPRIPEACYQR